MALLWNPDSWPQRLAELEAQTGDLKEAPLRRDVRSLGHSAGRGSARAGRQGAVRSRSKHCARGPSAVATPSRAETPKKLPATPPSAALALVHSLPVERAILLTRAFAFYFELINLAETNHRKRRRMALRLSGQAGRQRGSLDGTLARDAPRGH